MSDSMRVELRVEARDDLVEAAMFYESQQFGMGNHFSVRHFEDLQSLESQGGIHEKALGFHRKLSEIFPFAIYYLVAEDVVDVVAILDCRREPGTIAHRLGETKT